MKLFCKKKQILLLELNNISNIIDHIVLKQYSVMNSEIIQELKKSKHAGSNRFVVRLEH
jgi:hypothetical protein